MPALPTTSHTITPKPTASNSLSLPRSRTSTFPSAVPSSTQSLISPVSGSLSPTPTPTSTTFSAGTVIALSTVLPTIILILVAIIVYLLRARRKPQLRSQSRDNSNHELPVVDVQQELVYSHSEPPFITLSRHSISPFNISLHDLSKSIMLTGDNGSRRSPSRAESEKSRVSSDSGVAQHSDAQLPTLPPTAVTWAEPPQTPVLAMRYSSTQSGSDFRVGQHPSLYVERTSMESGTVSSVVFARGHNEEGSTGRTSRDELSRWGTQDARTSLSEFPDRPRTGMEISRQSAVPSTEQSDSSNETRGARASRRSGSKALKLLGIGPSSPYGLPPARAHLRSRSQPINTYGLPSLQLSPRARAPRVRRRSPSEINPPGDGSSNSSGRLHDSDSRAETQRIHALFPTSLSRPPPSTLPSTPEASSPRSSREGQTLSITIPPRLGTPIRPVAELIAMQSPPPQHTPRGRTHCPTPRSRSSSRTPGLVTPGQLSDLGALERRPAASIRSRGNGDSEPSPETRERVLRLLGRLPENPQGEGSTQNEEGRGVLPGSERTPRAHGADRAREVRRTRSEGELMSAFVQQSSDS
ncbi:hypothetical protein RhiJN_07082 [Ceratobasidium sp. AG-Ba]|nr:hypothetical protein RhiJN_07082 [Ceratobasidium sp. AG-Ba]